MDSFGSNLKAYITLQFPLIFFCSARLYVMYASKLVWKYRRTLILESRFLTFLDFQQFERRRALEGKELLGFLNGEVGHISLQNSFPSSRAA